MSTNSASPPQRTANGRAPKLATLRGKNLDLTKSKSTDQEHILLDRSPLHAASMPPSRSAPLDATLSTPDTMPMSSSTQHLHTASYPPIVSGFTMRDSVDSSMSQMPPLPSGGRYLLADRNIGWLIGTLSMLAIKTGGILPQAIGEQTYTKGLLWTQLPIAASLSILVGGFLFARAMYAEGFVTILDPFQQVYGPKISAIIFVPILLADLLYASIILTALGQLQSMALGIDVWVGVVSSCCALVCYLSIGGFYAGTFTDSLQYIYLALGILILTPVILLSDYSTSTMAESIAGHWGEVNGRNSGQYIDQYVMLILGGVPMQSYFQRIFSCKLPSVTTRVTIVSCIGCLITGIPMVLVGLAAHTIDWQNTTLGSELTAQNETAYLVLPYMISYVSPSAVRVIALGALVSGLLASADSAIFGLATICTHNFYRLFSKRRATTCRITWYTRASTLLITGLVMVLAVAWPYWHRHWVLPFDLLYVLVFPQLFCVVYFKYANSFGALAGTWTGLVVRLCFGETSIGLPPLIRLPFYHAQDGQLFPYRTLAMLANLLTTLIISALVEQLHRLDMIPSSQDMCIRKRQRQVVKRGAQNQRTIPNQAVLSTSEEETLSDDLPDRRRVQRFVTTLDRSEYAQAGGHLPPSPQLSRKHRHQSPQPMTISSLYRHAAHESRRQSPLLEKMTVL